MGGSPPHSSRPGQLPGLFQVAEVAQARVTGVVPPPSSTGSAAGNTSAASPAGRTSSLSPWKTNQ